LLPRMQCQRRKFKKIRTHHISAPPWLIILAGQESIKEWAGYYQPSHEMFLPIQSELMLNLAVTG
jgi:hypothetical protein